MRFFDFSSWQGILTSILGVLLFTLIAMGIRVLTMLTIQQRQQRMNRQINERLRTLIAAYKVLGGSFTGKLTVDPSHLGRSRTAPPEITATDTDTATVVVIADAAPGQPPAHILERRVQIRDAVEAALADILLLGTEDQVRLAGRAASDMAEGRPIHTAELVIALRAYIRKALDLETIPADVAIPAQGPTRPVAGGAGRGARSAGQQGGGQQTGGGAGGEGGGGGGIGMGMGIGMGRRGDEG